MQAGEDPQLSRVRQELGPRVQSKIVRDYPYSVYFRRAPSHVRARVQVVRILHQARDVEAAFAEEDLS